MVHVSDDDYLDVLKDASICLWNIYELNGTYTLEGNNFFKQVFQSDYIELQNFIDRIHKNHRENVSQTLYKFFALKDKIKITFNIKLEDKYKKILFQGKYSNDNFHGFIQILDDENLTYIDNDTSIAEILHEIRSPINSLIGIIHLLTNKTHVDEMKEQQQKYYNDLQVSSLSISNMITDILDNTKLQYEAVNSVEKKFNIKTLIGQVTQIIKKDLDDKGLKLYYYIDENICDNLIGNEVSLKQILINLINNAIKYTDNGYIKVLIKQEKIIGDTQTLLFSVIDNGNGIKPEYHDILFDPFIRDKKDDKGTGLGLFICKKLVNSLDGVLWCNSDKLGSTFNFTADFVIDDKAEDSQKIDFTIADNIKNCTILLADDNEINLEITKEILLSDGFFVDTCENGQHAVELALKHEYDFILLDILMPELDGIEAAKILKDCKISSKIIALTGKELNDKNDNYIFDGYIVKPLEPVMLYRLLESLKT